MATNLASDAVEAFFHLNQRKITLRIIKVVNTKLHFILQFLEGFTLTFLLYMNMMNIKSACIYYFSISKVPSDESNFH